MDKSETLKAMLSGHRVAHMHFTDEEYIHIVDGNIQCEKGYSMAAWFAAIKEETDWRWKDWSIVQICYECGKRIYKGEGSSLDDLNYAHHYCLKG